MDNDFNKTMSNKSKMELFDIEKNYLKYNKDALISYLKEIESRKLSIQKIEEIKNRIIELEAKVVKHHVINNPIILHPNLERVSKLILLGIPFSIIDILFLVFASYQILDRSLFSLMLSLFTFTVIFIWIIILLLSYWIKSGTSISRIVIGVLIGWSILSTTLNISEVLQANILSGIFSFIKYSVNIYIIFLLFNKETSEWYKENNNKNIDIQKDQS